MNRALLVVLAVGLLAFASCQPQDPQGPNLAQPFIGGTQGLALSFADGMPPPEIFDAGQSVFSVGVYMQNVGEAPIGYAQGRNSYGYVELIGISPQQFGQFSQQDLRVTWQDIQLELEGARRGYDGSIIVGDIDIVTIDELSYVPDRQGNTEVTMRANVCYEYATFTNTDICIKDDILENVFDDTICTLTGAKRVSNSGAPIQVTQVTQNPAGRDRMQVTFTIENKGMGTPFLPVSRQGFTDDACQQSVGQNQYRNMAYAEVSIGGDTGLYDINCPLLQGGSDRGDLRLWQGSPATVTCQITPLQTSSRIYTESMQIDLWYTYFESIETPVLIRDTSLGTSLRVEGNI